MKVLGIVCSPRKGGNTEIMMKEALSEAEESGAEIDLWTVAGKDIKPCDACEKCNSEGCCRIDDDMQELYRRLLEADGLIFGTPTYVWNVSGQAKIIMDRCRALYYPKRRMRDKAGGILITQTRGGGTGCFQSFSAFFNLHRIIGCGAAMGFGRDRGEIRQDLRALAEARAVGRVVVRTILRGQHIDPDSAIEQHVKLPDKHQYVPKSDRSS